MRNPLPITRFDPTAPLDLSPLMIGTHTVRRHRLAGTNYTVYSTMHGDDVAGRQISHPDASDCDSHIKRFIASTQPLRARSAMLDTHLHDSIVMTLSKRELDARDLCRMFAKTSTVLSPVLSMLVTEKRIFCRGTARRPIFTAPALPAHSVT